MKSSSLILILTMIVSLVSAQQKSSCLPEGISFYEQADIESFQADYPGCNEIDGDVFIFGENITDLNGLSVLTSIGGYLEISGTSLKSLSGLGNLANVGLGFLIGGNDSLTSLEGLESLVYIAAGLYIIDNNALTTLEGLEGLASVWSDIHIEGNNALVSLQGLENLNQDAHHSLFICDNYSLSDCEIESICDYMNGPTGIVNIRNNASGCNSVVDLAMACGGLSSCLPYGNYHFLSQPDIDNFQAGFPGCTGLAGNVTISGNEIINLGGLNIVDYIDGYLEITCYTLESLAGLDALQTVSGSILIKGTILTDLSGLDNLSSVGDTLLLEENFNLSGLQGLESLTIVDGPLMIMWNYELESLAGLNALQYVGGTLYILENDNLPGLGGIDNIGASSISELLIYDNQVLSDCAVKSICDYLVLLNGDAGIALNSPGCNSIEEVEEACDGLGIQSAAGGQRLSVSCFPNPTFGFTAFQFSLPECQRVTLKVYDVHGREVGVVLDQQLTAGEHTVRWNADGLPAGVYIFRLSSNDQRYTTVGGKLLKYNLLK